MLPRAPTKPKQCAYEPCSKSFLPLMPMQRVCGPVCAGRLVKAEKQKEKANTRARKAALKRIPDLLKEAQREFNSWVRRRDMAKPCISCGKPLVRAGADACGGGFDAGHYRSVGSAAHLRFNEHNCHAQCKHCNRYGAGRAVDYRIGLIQRIGLAAVEALETDNRTHKWQRDELIAIRDLYRKKLKELKLAAVD